jgi:DNA-binding HxlR family transcriptional regulator
MHQSYICLVSISSMHKKVTCLLKSYLSDYQVNYFKIMEKKIKRPLPKCGIDYAFQRIGGKYKGRILWRLRIGILRYGELRKAITGVTAKMLTQALRELEDDGLITRRVYVEVPPKVEYALTDSGKDLLPFLSLLRDWSRQQMLINNIEAMPNPA